tara:strand:- start:5916 stop:7241 length:1326 start_codon:yes stop_codon:yes gene_type:complete
MSGLNYNLDNYSKIDLFEMFDLDIEKDFDKNELNENYNKMLTNVKAEQCIPDTEKNLILDFLDKAFKKMLENDYEYKLTEGNFMPNLEKNEVFSEENPVIKKKINDEFKSLINPLKKITVTKMLSIDTLFRKNYYSQSSTDFIIDLPETLKNVTSITLTNTDIPNTMYTFSSLTGTNEFAIETYEKVSGTVQNEKRHIIKIKNGNFTPTALVDYLNKYIFSPAITENNKELRMVACYYDEANKKISFFRDKRAKSNSEEGGVRDGFLYDDTTASAGLEYFFNIDWTYSKDENRSIQLGLGWILGYRKRYYSYDDDYITMDKVFSDNSEGFGAEACYQNTFGKRYVFLSIEDFNKNFSKSLMSPFENSIINDINIFAKINNYYDSFNYSNGDVDYQFRRSYFGPVDIMKLRVKLLDEFGRVVDLNNSDFSFILRIEQLYDST